MNRLGFFLCAVALLFAQGAPHANAGDKTPSSASYILTGPARAIRGLPIQITVSVQSRSEPINAMQGTILFPTRMLTVEQIRLTNSIIRYWQHAPNADASTGHISFTGGLPTPGFQGENGTLFTIIARPTAVGEFLISSGPKSIILANDTKGTILNTQQAELLVSSQEQTYPEENQTPIQPEDRTPPTQLELRVGKDFHLFNNKWFAAFQASDAESGIDHYEIAETNTQATYPTEQEWTRTQSPYILHNQTKRGRVFLKAVDKSGNSAVMSASFNPCPSIPWWILLSICLSIVFCLYTARRYNTHTQLRENKKNVQTK